MPAHCAAYWIALWAAHSAAYECALNAPNRPTQSLPDRPAIFHTYVSAVFTTFWSPFGTTKLLSNFSAKLPTNV